MNFVPFRKEKLLVVHRSFENFAELCWVETDGIEDYDVAIDLDLGYALPLTLSPNCMHMRRVMIFRENGEAKACSPVNCWHER